MNHLHEIVYQIVSNPGLLADNVQDLQTFLQQLDITLSEAQALLEVFKDNAVIGLLQDAVPAVPQVQPGWPPVP